MLAEQRGFDSVFISDHFQPWRHHGGHAPFSLAWLGALGARSSRCIMGTSVLTPTFRYHPSIVAQAFATLGCPVPGRVILGLGSGESLNEVPATGMAWPEQKERTARFKEAVRLIRQLWTQERLSFDGHYYRTLQCHHLRSAHAAAAAVHRRGRPRAGEVCRRDRAKASSAPAAKEMRCIATCCCRMCSRE